MEESLKSEIGKVANLVDQYLSSMLNGTVSLLWDAANHYVKSGGKRLRPFLVLKSAALVGHENKLEMNQAHAEFSTTSILPVASAIEILHTFTLIHDDIMDNDDFRRNVPSVHSKWGIPIAILSGDLLFAESFLLVADANINPEKKAKISERIGKVSRELCEGQAMDVRFEDRTDVSVEEYLEMIRLKTGALFKTSAEIGGILGEGSAKHIEKLGIYGERLGIAFQIVDDILGIIAQEEELGKPIGSDLREGKRTFIVLNTVEQLDLEKRVGFMRLLSKQGKSDEEISEIKNLISQTKSIKAAQQLASKYISEALDSLQDFSDQQTKLELIRLAEFCIQRGY